jgi:hypothetical protein
MKNESEECRFWIDDNLDLTTDPFNRSGVAVID